MFGLLQYILRLLAVCNVIVDLKDRQRLAFFVGPELPFAVDNDLLPVLCPMAKFPFPLSIGKELFPDLRPWFGVFGFQELRDGATYCLLAAKTKPVFGAPVPEYDLVFRVADDDGVFGYIDDLGLVTEYVGLAFQFVLGPQALCYITDVYHDELLAFMTYKR